MQSPFVVAVDGPSGSGKSSTARGVARQLDFAYLDTGSMYRAMTWAVLQRGIDPTDTDAVIAASSVISIEAGTDPLAPTITADGVDVSVQIRSDEVTSKVSAVAAVPQVRDLLVRLQRAVIARTDPAKGIVVEGRDIGATVAPDAPVKIYLVADVAARAARRAAELGGVDTATTAEALATRDQIDSTRTASPLAKAPGSILIDSTHLSLDDVIDRITALVKEQL